MYTNNLQIQELIFLVPDRGGRGLRLIGPVCVCVGGGVTWTQSRVDHHTAAPQHQHQHVKLKEHIMDNGAMHWMLIK